MRSLSLVSGQPLLNKIGVTGSLGGARAMYVAMLWYGQVKPSKDNPLLTLVKHGITGSSKRLHNQRQPITYAILRHLICHLKSNQYLWNSEHAMLSAAFCLAFHGLEEQGHNGQLLQAHQVDLPVPQHGHIHCPSTSQKTRLSLQKLIIVPLPF